MTETAQWQNRYDAVMMPNYGTPDVVLSSGDGCIVTDVDGKTYLDLFAGIAVSSLGHNHPALVEAVNRQVATIAHTSNLFVNEPEVVLAEKLVDLLGAPARVLFTNSGTEANEAALKLAILHGKSAGRGYVVAAEDGFHGRTLGALSVTGKASIREPFGPFGIDVRFVPYGDADALKNAVTTECAAVIMEPTQGEAGVIPPPPGYLQVVRDVCDATGALFIADEVQSGIGRTGTWFAHQQHRVLPDVVTLAKGLGGGLPIGAVLGVGDAGTVLTKGMHGSTFGGNAVTTAAAIAVLDTIETDGLLQHVVMAGHHLASGVRALRHPLVAHTRGSGLWRGIVLVEDVAAEAAGALRAAGFIVNPVRPNVLRVSPPLIVTLDQLDLFLDALPDALDAAYPPGERP